VQSAGVLALAALIVLRSAVFTLAPGAAFDSDQAVMGLMAKHLSEGRAFPLFIYGQHHMLAVEAWLAAPLFLLSGPSVALLKLPLVLINVATAIVLVELLRRETGLPLVLAFASALFFVVPPPGTAAALVEAGGGNLEQFLYILLLWITRERGAWFGAILAFGFLHREFTIYGLFALLIVEALDRSSWTRANLLTKGRAVAAGAAVWVAVAAMRPVASAAGPGTSATDLPANSGVQTLTARLCGDVGALLGSGPSIYRDYLALLFGIPAQPVSDFAVNSTVVQGMPGMAIVAGALLVICLAGVAHGLRASRLRDLRFCAYLILVGLFSIMFYTWGRCGQLSIYTLRYGLLALLGATGLAAAALRLQPSRAFRVAIVALVLVWTTTNMVAHVRIAHEYLTEAPPNWRGIVAEFLMSHGVRYAESNYWTAYHVTFLANERVIVSTNEYPRIGEYQKLVDAHRAEAWTITTDRCDNGREIIPRWYACPPGSGP
jgi:hypothetical protein